MASRNPYEDLDAHERLMTQIQSVSDQCVIMLEKAAQVLDQLETHNENQNSHPYILQKLESAAIMTEDDVDTSINAHNNSSRSHQDIRETVANNRTSLSADIASVAGRVQNLEAASSNAAAYMDRLNQHMDSIDETNATLTATQTQQTNTLQTLSNSSRQFAEDIAAIRAINESNGSTLRSLSQTAAAHTDSIVTHESRLATVESKTSNLEVMVNGMQPSVETYGNKIATLTQGLASQNQTIQAQNDAISANTQRIADANARIDSLTADMANINQLVIEPPVITYPRNGGVMNTGVFSIEWTNSEIRYSSREDDTYFIAQPTIDYPGDCADVPLNFRMIFSGAYVQSINDVEYNEFEIEEPAILSPIEDQLVDDKFKMTWSAAIIHQYRMQQVPPHEEVTA